MHVTGLAAASSKTITGIAREVLPAQGDLAHAYSLLDEAQAAVERTQHDDTEQTYREIAYDCYD